MTTTAPPRTFADLPELDQDRIWKLFLNLDGADVESMLNDRSTGQFARMCNRWHQFRELKAREIHDRRH